MFTLDAIMTTNLMTVSPTESLAEARSIMQEHGIRHLPVVEDGDHLVGLLTQTNVLAATDSILRDAENRMRAKDISVADVMVTKIATVNEHATLRQAARYLEKHRIGCLPVVTKGNLVGIITDTDFVGVAINLIEQLEELEPVEEDFAESQT